MSVMCRAGYKIILPRGGADEFWQLVEEHYAGADPHKWKLLAMLALRENADWNLERIGFVFGHSRGHVSRSLARIKVELRERLAPDGGERGEKLKR
jgi:hypothetical protein